MVGLGITLDFPSAAAYMQAWKETQEKSLDDTWVRVTGSTMCLSIHWDKGVIFNPRGKSRKSRRYVPLTERVKAALVSRKESSTKEDGSSHQRRPAPGTLRTARFRSSGWKPNGWRVFQNRSFCIVLVIASQPTR